MTENRMRAMEELRQAEIRFWQKMHPKAKVMFKKNTIVIEYPLPTDFDAISKFTERYV